MYYNEYDEDFWKALDNLIDNSEIAHLYPNQLAGVISIDSAR